MAPTFTQVLRGKIDQQNVTIYTMTFDDAYPAGGEAVAASSIGLETISALIPLGSPAGATFEWTGGKIKAYYADYSTTTDGLLIEIAVGDTAILDGVELPILAIGI